MMATIKLHYIPLSLVIKLEVFLPALQQCKSTLERPAMQALWSLSPLQNFASMKIMGVNLQGVKVSLKVMLQMNLL